MVKGKRHEIKTFSKMIKSKRKYSYKKLIVYQKAKLLAITVYKTSDKFPRSEKYGITSQTRRAAVSVVANLVEGYVKDSSAEYSRFLTIAIGSLAELEVLLDLSKELNFINESEFNKIYNLITEVRRLLYGTRKSVRLKS